jgi:hypothetical protein
MSAHRGKAEIPPQARLPLLAIRGPCSVALDAGGVISAMRP